jgi:DNA topoisomerase-1
VKSDPEAEKANSTGVKCTVCKSGEMVERKGRFGIFYSCSNYPDCKYAIKAKPTGNICKECGSLMMEGTKTIPERCSDKLCPNHNPHKINNRILVFFFYAGARRREAGSRKNSVEFYV